MKKYCILLAALMFSSASYSLTSPNDVIDCESYISNHRDFYGMLKQRLRVCNDMPKESIACLDTIRDTEIFEELDEEVLEICEKHSAQDVLNAYHLSREGVFRNVFRVDAVDMLSINDQFTKDEINCAVTVGEANGYGLISIMDTLHECRVTLNDLSR